MRFTTVSTMLSLDSAAYIDFAGVPGGENLIRESLPFAVLSYYTPAPAFTNEWVRPFISEPPVEVDAVAAKGSDSAFTVRFADDSEADFTCDAHDAALVFTLRAFRPGTEKIPALICFNQMALHTNAAAACVLMPLNPETRSLALPGAAPLHCVDAQERVGFTGASCAVFVDAWANLRVRMQTVTKTLTDRIPWLPCAGAFAQDTREMQGSYMMIYGAYLPGSLCPQNLDRWIQMLKEIGLTQVDFHGAEDKNFTFGAFEPNRAIYPEGRKSLTEVTQRLRENGVSSIFHTYSSQVSPGSPLMTPVPDPRLGNNRVFTLTADVSAGDTVFPIAEDTAAVSLVHTGHYNSSRYAVWDEEIIEFTALGNQKLEKCVRGVFGTKPAAHQAGTEGRNLKRMYNIFLPDVGGSLFHQIAADTAACAEECGFTAFYFDALEAVVALEGREYIDYYSTKFTYEVARHLHSPAGMEMSHMNANLWYVRSRMGAWDRPSCAHKKFLERHAEGNRIAQKLCMLPQNLGWWYFGQNIPGAPANTDRLTTDVYETMGRLATAYNFSMSFQGLTDTAFFACDDLQRFASMVRRWETMRLSGTLTDAERARLAAGECHMDGDRIYPAVYRNAVAEFRDGQAEITLDNPHGTQTPFLLRFEPLHSPSAAAEKTEAVFDINELLQPGGQENTGDAAFPDPVSDTPVFFPDYPTLVIPTRTVKAFAVWEDSPHGRALLLNVTAARPIGCARAEQRFEHPLNIHGQYGFGVWIEGDGKGEVVNLELRSHHLQGSGLFQKLVVVDFTGWKYFSLIECGAAQVMEYQWPFYMGLRETSGEFLPIRRESNTNDWPESMFMENMYIDNNANPHHITGSPADYTRIAFASVWINNLPQGETCTVRVAGWHTFFTESRDVADIRMGGISIQGNLPAGSIAEYSDGAWFTAGSDSRPVAASVSGTPQALAAGENRLTISANVPDGTRLHVVAGLQNTADAIR